MTTCQQDLGIAQRIARADLSPSHRRVADVVLDQPLRVATMRMEDLAEIAGVSVATTNRFARALGYDGYAQFRADLVLSFEAALAPVAKASAAALAHDSAATVLADALAQTAANVAMTRQTLDAAQCERAVAAILGARRVFIAGFGSSAWLGGLLQRKLDLYCDQVHLLASVEGATFGARSLGRAGPGDLLIAIAFPRYLNDTVRLAQMGHAAGATGLAITDGPKSPLVAFADLTLYATADSRHFANCEASALALIEALSCAVAHASGRAQVVAKSLAEAVLPWLHGPGAAALRSARRAAPELHRKDERTL